MASVVNMKLLFPMDYRKSAMLRATQKGCCLSKDDGNTSQHLQLLQIVILQGYHSNFFCLSLQFLCQYEMKSHLISEAPGSASHKQF